MNYKEEYVRCATDKTRRYFIEKYLHTFDADERKERPFMLFPRQQEFVKSLAFNNNTIAVKHRQAGITTVTSGWITGQCTFASPGSPETVLCIGNKLDISEQLVEKIANFLDQVPRWMWGKEYYSPDPNNKKNIRSIYKARNKNKIELFNGCKIYARSSGENAARGISAVSILVFDEAAFIANGPSVYSQAVAATASVSNAKIVMVSTPNGKDLLYYNTYSKALKKQNNYNAVEFKWYQDLRYNRNLQWSRKNPLTGDVEFDVDPVVGPKGAIKYDEERWRKLEAEGWKPESPWYINMCNTWNWDEMRIAQELDVSFLGSSNNVVPVEVIEAHLNQNVIEITENWPFRDKFAKETWIWKLPIPGHRYILCADPSSGSADDETAIEILDVDAVDENGRPFVDQVLEYVGKRTGDEIGQIIHAYGTAYNNALVVIEGIGGYGDSAILTLMSMKYPNLYYDDPGLKTYTVEKAYSKFNIKKGEKLPGFRTSSMRVQMITNFVSMIKENSFRIRSMRVINELETWVFKNGRVDHMDGFHDDALTCLAMGLFVMEFSMLRTEKEKSKSAAMLNAWMVSSMLNSQQQPQQQPQQKPVVNKPFIYSGNSLERQRNKRLYAMMMMGGIKPKPGVVSKTG